MKDEEGSQSAGIRIKSSWTGGKHHQTRPQIGDKARKDKQNGRGGLTFEHSCSSFTLVRFVVVFLRVVRVIRGDFPWRP
ncbi:MAG: hypothetical protein ACRELF_17375 [Gemmataceae bacterium]